MKNRLSQNDLNKLYRKEVRKSGKQKVFDKFRDDKSNRENGRKNIFLSHSHLDKTIVVKIGLLFEKLNTNLYIDWLDDTLPEKTSRITANEIKRKINGSDKFIFLATYHGLRSKWCNWELGVADSLKNYNNVVVLPIETSTGNWKGNEYVELYQEMRVNNFNFEEIIESDITVVNKNGNNLTFKKWLNS